MTQDITAADFCWGCMQNEPIPAGVQPFRICGECGHAFLTEADLVEADRLWWADEYLGPPSDISPRPSEEIFSCPICIHDF